MADNWNKLKNMASKAIGEKMKVRERILHNCCISQRKYGTMSKKIPNIKPFWKKDQEMIIGYKMDQ